MIGYAGWAKKSRLGKLGHPVQARMPRLFRLRYRV
jgi:hypothetical protein